jgi:hypothetical protein
VAKQIIERLVDDLDGGDAAETVRFAYDGIDYTIDLSTKNAGKLRKALGPYVDNGVKTTPGRKAATRIEDTVAGRALIRTWARKNGWPELSDRGRIPAEATAAYRRANGNR